MTSNLTIPPVAHRDLSLAVRLVDEAAQVAVNGFETAVGSIRHKLDGSEVTATDLAVEDLLRARLAERCPADAVLGEERSATTGSSGRRWVIDPISGTADFVRRVPLFSIDLAMEDEHGPALAVSVYPIGGLMMAGGRGLGCWVLADDVRELVAARRTRVDGRAQLDGAVVCAHSLKDWSGALLSAVHRRCVLRDGVHSVVRLLRGEAHAVIVAGGAMSYDDLACLPVLVQEAGGRVTDLSGRPVLDGDGSVLATNGELHDSFLDLVADRSLRTR